MKFIFAIVLIFVMITVSTFAIAKSISNDVTFNAIHFFLSRYFIDPEHANIQLKINLPFALSLLQQSNRIAAYNALVNGMDDYTDYIPPDDHAFQSNVKGSYSGIGVRIRILNSKVEIFELVSTSSPAARAGIKPGDVITSVNGLNLPAVKSLDKLDNIIKLLLGPINSTVRLTIERSKKSIDFNVLRQQIELDAISRATSLSFKGKQYHYVHISSFDDNVVDDFKQAITGLDKQTPASGIIIDLRYNPGGNLEETVKFVSLLTGPDHIAVRIKESQQTEIHQTTSEKFINQPVVVLVNGHSASASEIVAAAWQTHRVATIVGSKTFGKGVVQTLIPLSPDGSFQNGLLKITTSEYFTPDGRKVHKVGVIPDVEIANLNQDASGLGNTDTDFQLRVALSALSMLTK